VYDGVFVGLTVRDADAANSPIVFRQTLPPVQSFFRNVVDGMEKVVNWFIQNL
jgi:hypothetical protein